MPHKSLRKYRIVDEGVEQRLEVDKSQVFHMLSSMVDNPLHSDITFIVGNEKIRKYGHSLILRMRVPYFDRMLGSGMMEAQQRTVEKNDVHPHVFHVLLNYIYTGQCELTIDIVVQLMAVARQMDLDQLFAKCKEHLRRHITHEVAFALLEDAMMLHLEVAKHIALRFILENSSFILKDPSFVELSPECIQEIVASDVLCTSEIILFEVIHRWVDHNAEQNGVTPYELFQEFLPHLRFGIIEPHNLVDIVEPLGLVPLGTLYRSMRNSSAPNRLSPEQQQEKFFLYRKASNLALTRILFPSDLEMLAKWILNHGLYPSDFSFCYHCDKDQFFDPDEFHATCDDRGPSIVLLKTQFGTIGGFAKASWKPEEYHYISGIGSFLFCFLRKIEPDLQYCTDEDQFNESKFIKETVYNKREREKEDLTFEDQKSQDELRKNVVDVTVPLRPKNETTALYYDVGCGPQFGKDLAILPMPESCCGCVARIPPWEDDSNKYQPIPGMEGGITLNVERMEVYCMELPNWENHFKF
eukprot:gb/GECH01004209.1/.p1 GENE.gb/GECH01004209.1/~~gb/GECH01004209.1/.p1  ORF type:complete len:526 (+),score=96.92 gb/GECH01004209.1/:1-1578(+)